MEFQIPLEAKPLLYSDNTSSLYVISNVRGALSKDQYEIVESIIRVLEPMPHESIHIDYRYHFSSLGNIPVQPASFTDALIPGICVTLTDNFIDGDKAVIIKHDQIKTIGQENGGNNKVELSLKLRSSDDKMLERMTARTFFIFTDQISLFELTDQGISLENSVSYARSYEERDGNSEKWVVNTFRLVIHHTWRYLIPYVTDLNTLNVSMGIIQDTHNTGAPSFHDLLASTTPDSWIQPY